MKVTIRIPTDQYAYAEVEKEFDTNPSPEDVAGMYREFKEAFTVKEGLSAKDFNAWLDRYLTDNTGDVEMYVKMNPEQQGIIQAIKRSVNRISAKNK